MTIMEGFLVLFKSSKREDITRINHCLFGRIAYNSKGKYFYKGLLDSIPYIRLTNGCYFITQNVGDVDGLIIVRKCDFNTENDRLLTAREYWLEHSKNNGWVEVKNL